MISPWTSDCLRLGTLDCRVFVDRRSSLPVACDWRLLFTFHIVRCSQYMTITYLFYLFFPLDHFWVSLRLNDYTHIPRTSYELFTNGARFYSWFFVEPTLCYEQCFRHLLYFYNGLMLGIGPTGTIRVGLICRDDALAVHNRKQQGIFTAAWDQ